MAYQKTEWKDHIVETPNKYAQTANADGTVTLTKREGNVVQSGTPVSASNLNKMENGIAEAHAQLDQTGRASQTLIAGVSVLNGQANAPVNVQIEGRTLIPMQNTVLDPAKFYALADKKTRLKWADASTTQGVSKFTGKAERPALIRIANFEGKTVGSTLENPHVAMRPASTSGDTYKILQPPNGLWSEFTSYAEITSVNGAVYTRSLSASGEMAQVRFSFDIVAEVERQLGRIPRTTLAEKIQWLKGNIVSQTAEGMRLIWKGMGSSPTGNKASLAYWNGTEWRSAATYTGASIGILERGLGGSGANFIQPDGFVHFIAYAEPSNGTVPSVISTAAADFSLDLKPEAILHDPRVPLYEVTKEHYDAIGVTWSEAETMSRYPSVEGVTHLQNPYVLAEGENLLPPFSEWNFPSQMNANLVSPYEVEITPSIAYQAATVTIDVLPGQPITLQTNGFLKVASIDVNGTEKTLVDNSSNVKKFTTPADIKRLRLYIYTNLTGVKVTFKNPILSLGDSEKPFTPRNPSYLLTETKLAKIGTAADMLFEQDGKLVKRKVVEDVVLDMVAYNPTSYGHENNGYKGALFSNFYQSQPIGTALYVLTKPNGAIRANANFYTGEGISNLSGTNMYLSALNSDTGFSNGYQPVPGEWKAFFNGWKVKTADANNKPTAWVSVVDGTDAPTQTLDYVAANKAPNYTPYKLSYVLATPKIEEIRSEGSISVNGLTQVEVGAGVVIREKVTPYKNGNGNYSIGEANYSPLLKKPERILKVYEENKEVLAFERLRSYTQGKERVLIAAADFNTGANYYVTYLAFDRQPFTTNPVNVMASFANNIRAALDDVVKQSEDARAAISVNSLLMYDVLKRLKAGGL